MVGATRRRGRGYNVPPQLEQRQDPGALSPPPRTAPSRHRSRCTSPVSASEAHALLGFRFGWRIVDRAKLINRFGDEGLKVVPCLRPIHGTESG
jgi:hypothetical protein